MNNDILLFLKGLAMGAANVIPGVSGGTIALIAGIYERLINALKSFDVGAIRLITSGKLNDFWLHIDGRWLSILLAGVAVSIVSLARMFEFLLNQYEHHTMAFFFGLILLSVMYVGQRIHQWTATNVLALIIGAAIAVSIALLAPASENPSFVYVFLCGVVAISSMILPGLSGSFILIMMGNYALVLGAISSFSLNILIPLALGCAFGLVVFSHLLAWVFKHYEQHTLALMTGFVIGSLVVIWPWKTAQYQTIEQTGKAPREVVTSYNWFMPDWLSMDTWFSLLMMAAGLATIALMERMAGNPSD